MKIFRLAALGCLGCLIFLMLNASLTISAAQRCSDSACTTAIAPDFWAMSFDSSSDAIAANPSGVLGTEATRPAYWPLRRDVLAADSSNGEASPMLSQSDFLEEIPIVVLGILASLLAGLATGVGALPILFMTSVSDRVQSYLLGFAAGVMLAATSFSLLIPSIEWVTAEGGGSLVAAGIAVAGTVIGSGFIWITDRNLPYDRFIEKPMSGVDPAKLKGIWLFILAIAIHNFPEGLAVGVGFGGGNVGNGLALAIGIGLQNLPEGLAVALALVTQKYGRWQAFWIALLTGLLEPLGGIVGVGIISVGEALLPWGLAFAAGAMLFVIGDEVIPEAQHLESGKLATTGIVVGFVIMMFLDVSLG